MNPQIGEVWQIKLYPVRGSEQDGIRPCLVVSPNSMNKALSTIIVVPLTRSKKDWPTRILLDIKGTESQACIEHIRSVAKERFLEKICIISKAEMATTRKHLVATFAE